VRVSFIVLNSDDKLKTFSAIENWCFIWIISRAAYRFVVFRRIVVEVRYFMYVCPCIIYENDERYQLDATILFIIINKHVELFMRLGIVIELRFHTRKMLCMNIVFFTDFIFQIH